MLPPVTSVLMIAMFLISSAEMSQLSHVFSNSEFTIVTLAPELKPSTLGEAHRRNLSPLMVTCEKLVKFNTTDNGYSTLVSVVRVTFEGPFPKKLMLLTSLTSSDLFMK